MAGAAVVGGWVVGGAVAGAAVVGGWVVGGAVVGAATEVDGEIVVGVLSSVVAGEISDVSPCESGTRESCSRGAATCAPAWNRLESSPASKRELLVLSSGDVVVLGGSLSGSDIEMARRSSPLPSAPPDNRTGTATNVDKIANTIPIGLTDLDCSGGNSGDPSRWGALGTDRLRTTETVTGLVTQPQHHSVVRRSQSVQQPAVCPASSGHLIDRNSLQFCHFFSD